MTDQPTFRHDTSACKISRCRVCLDDHLAMGDYLFFETGASRRCHDILSEFRSWLENIKGATDAELNGWLNPLYQNEFTYREFIDYWRGKHD